MNSEPPIGQRMNYDQNGLNDYRRCSTTFPFWNDISEADRSGLVKKMNAARLAQDAYWSDVRDEKVLDITQSRQRMTAATLRVVDNIKALTASHKAPENEPTSAQAQQKDVAMASMEENNDIRAIDKPLTSVQTLESDLSTDHVSSIGQPKGNETDQGKGKAKDVEILSSSGSENAEIIDNPPPETKSAKGKLPIKKVNGPLDNYFKPIKAKKDLQNDSKDKEKEDDRRIKWERYMKHLDDGLATIPLERVALLAPEKRKMPATTTFVPSSPITAGSSSPIIPDSPKIPSLRGTNQESLLLNNKKAKRGGRK